MKILRKYHVLIFTFLLLSLSAYLAYIPFIGARKAGWVNPEFNSYYDIPYKTDPWLEKQKELEKEQEKQEKLQGKNI
jgi:hypothetical protein